MDHAYANPAAAPPARLLSPPVPAEDRWENTRLFLMTFAAGFLAFYGLIA